MPIINENFGQLTTLCQLIQEPARLFIMSYLSLVEYADFLFLVREMQLTDGNLSSHLSKLEEAGYVKIQQAFTDERFQTLCTLSSEGDSVFQIYRQAIKTALYL